MTEELEWKVGRHPIHLGHPLTPAKQYNYEYAVIRGTLLLTNEELTGSMGLLDPRVHNPSLTAYLWYGYTMGAGEGWNWEIQVNRKTIAGDAELGPREIATAKIREWIASRRLKEDPE